MNEPALHPRSPVMTAAGMAEQAVAELTGMSGSAGAGGSALKLAIVGPTHADHGEVAAHTTNLAHQLAQAGHDVTLVSWTGPFPRTRVKETEVVPGTGQVLPFPRTVRALSWALPHSWVRTGRRLRAFDAIIVVHVTPLLVPAHLAMLRAARVGTEKSRRSGVGTPRAIVLAYNVLPQAPRPGDSALLRSLFESVDAVMVHSAEQAGTARDLHAARVCVVNPVPLDPTHQQQHVPTPDLSSPWAHYVGAMEALASPDCHAAEQDPVERSVSTPLRRRLAAPLRQMMRRRRATLPMTRADLPGWVRPSDVLGDGADADGARSWARAFGLPRCADPVAAWAALGAVAAIVRLGDDGHRNAVIVDGSGARSPLSRWARAIGFAPVELDLTTVRSSGSALDVDTSSLDVITQLHPNGCDSEDVDEALSQASWALRPGGLISLTLPLGPAGAEGAVGPADVRAILARAHALGLVLVGDLDGDISTLMRAASEGERRSDAAYALVLLTFRRL
jgi:SAM-dependent methyltransferase